jgi:2-iminobutanoate/2-iminopropanoate deaminase
MPAIERLMLDGQPAPVSHYCHVTKAGSLIWISGTVGVAADGSIPDDVVAQFEIAIANLDACLRSRRWCCRR